MSFNNLTGTILRRILGLLKTSWESFDEDFKTWHRDPEHPDRQFRSCRTEELEQDVEELAARLGPKYWNSTSSHVEPFSAQWPAQKELITNVLVRFTVYKGSERKRRQRHINSNTNNSFNRLRSLVAAAGGPPGEVLKRLELIAEEMGRIMNRNPGGLQTIASQALEDMTNQDREAIAAEGLQILATQGLQPIFPGAISTPLQPMVAMGPCQIANTTLLVGISTKPYVKAVPFSSCTNSAMTKFFILSAWSDHISVHSVEAITVYYPWSSSRNVQLFLENERDFEAMKHQIAACPAWTSGEGVCHLEVEIEIVEEEGQNLMHDPTLAW